MWKRVLIDLMMALGLASSAAFAAKEGPQVAPPAGYRLELSFTSAVPDFYYVMSGPTQSYSRYRVNEQLGKALKEYAARADRDPGGRVVRLSVHLESVVTDYREIGSYQPPGAKGQVRPAGLELLWRSDLDLDRNERSIPVEITKTVVLMLEAEIAREGEVPRKESFHASAKEVIDRDHWDNWAYDYREVIRMAVRNAVVEVDRVIRKELK